MASTCMSLPGACGLQFAATASSSSRVSVALRPIASFLGRALETPPLQARCAHRSRRSLVVRAEEAQEMQAEEAQEVRAEEAQEVRAEEAQEVRAEEAQEVRAEEAQEVRAEEAQEVQAEEAQEVQAEEVKEVQAEEEISTEVKEAKGLSRETGGQWLSCTTRHVRIYAGVIDPESSLMDQSQLDKLTLMLDPDDEFEWPEEATEKVYDKFRELIDIYAGADLTEYTLRLVGSDLEHYIRKLLLAGELKYNLDCRVLNFSMGKPRMDPAELDDVEVEE